MSETASALARLVLPANATERADRCWAAVVSLSLGVFGLVTAEFLPASLLTEMARDLDVTVGTAGQAVTATAVVAGVAGLTRGDPHQTSRPSPRAVDALCFLRVF